ncbi:unnamed protein product, partial [Dibothriocephalus latus]
MSANNDNQTKKEAEIDEDEDEDDDDFLEVPPLVDASLRKPPPLPSSDPDEKLLADQEVYVTDKLPWELETAQSDRPRTFYSSNSCARRPRKSDAVRRHSNKTVAAKVAVSDRAPEDCVVPQSESTFFRASETQHRFWKPIEPEEYEAPDVDQMEAAISLNPHTEPPP